jgi:hypothetical protein
MQHLPARAVWDEHAVRDDIRDWLVEHLGDPAAVLVVDETGDSSRAPTQASSTNANHRPSSRSHRTASPR